MDITVKKNGTLFDRLLEEFSGASKTTVKQRIVHGAITVNGKLVTNPSTPVNAGDRIGYRKHIPSAGQYKPPFPVLYEDEVILIAEKPAGLLTVGDKGQGGTSFYQVMSSYVREKSKGNERLYVVHRLDREVSGLLIFAKTEPVQEEIKNHWQDNRKLYYALVEGDPKRDEETIRSYLREGHDQRVYSTKIEEGAKLAITHYRVMDRTPGYALLEVELQTGRKNQIRVHLAEMGCPVVGDRRYGADATYERRIRLHAYYLSMKHPLTGATIEVKSRMPRGFLVLKPENEKYK